MRYKMHVRFYGTGDVSISARDEREAYEKFENVQQTLEAMVASKFDNGECDIEDYEITDEFE